MELHASLCNCMYILELSANILEYSLGLSERAKQFIWECVLSLEDVSLYQLEVAR